MPLLPATVTVLAVWTVVVIVPGPDFLARTHHALVRSPKAACLCPPAAARC